MNQQNPLEKKQYHFVYQTTNLINGKIYIGKHSTYNLDDGYLGSGTHLQNAIKKYGKENFKREIIHLSDTSEEAYLKEEEIVDTHFILREDTYNQVLGGAPNGKDRQKGFVTCVDTITNENILVTKEEFYSNDQLIGSTKGKGLKNIKGKNVYINKDHPLYNSLPSVHVGKVSAINSEGEFIQVTKEEFEKDDAIVGIASGKIVVKDQEGNTFQVSKDDPRWLSGELVGVTKGQVTVKDESGMTLTVPVDDERFLSGKLLHTSSGKIVVKDQEGNTFQVSKDDPRWLSGELVGVTKGKNLKKTEWRIFDENDMIIDIVENENFEKFLKRNGYPCRFSSSRKGNRYLENNSLKRVKPENIKFKGWYVEQTKGKYKNTKK